MSDQPHRDLPPRPGDRTPEAFGLYPQEPPSTAAFPSAAEPPPLLGPPPHDGTATYVVEQGPGVEPPRTTLRDRVLSLRAVAAVALASVILGAGGGVALGAVTDGSSTSGGPGGQGFPGGQQGQQFGQQAPDGTDDDTDDDTGDGTGTTTDDGTDDGTDGTGTLPDGTPVDPFAGQGAPPAPPGGMPGSTAPRDDTDTESAAPGTTSGTT